MMFSTLSKSLCLFMLITQMGFVVCNDGSVLNQNKVKARRYHRLKVERQGLVPKAHFKGNRFATAVHADSSPNYLVYVPSIITNVASLLTQNRTDGSKAGAMLLTNEGVKVEKSGDYWVDFNTILQNQGVAIREFTVFVQTSENFSLNNQSNVIGFETISVGDTASIQGGGILKNLKQGTKISLVIQASLDPDRLAGIVNVVYWDISIFKIGSRKHEERT